jgi:hypothetical protein
MKAGASACLSSDFYSQWELIPRVKDDNGFSVEDWAKIEMYEGLAQVLDMLRRSDPRPGSHPNGH